MGSSSVSNGVVVAVVFAAVVLVVFPGFVADFVKEPQHAPTEGAAGEESTSSFLAVANLLRIAHVTGFATNFGMSLWVSFIGGVIMFKYVHGGPVN